MRVIPAVGINTMSPTIPTPIHPILLFSFFSFIFVLAFVNTRAIAHAFSEDKRKWLVVALPAPFCVPASKQTLR